ncbi:aminobenzoyl-glutamate utilization protein A [Geomicrobium halophilum]|uniref:Aminobenzoyl-glutamate utilization protein A n=1 Tax=Geomicrobium halophilum TaxID=549000 RepID=A0A841PMR6_9BACL|nr:amidohydrolase [Geomicrobium halophilum]MBB6450050.1 aminobenzoyl-glutamate utilization protein A [Geomicrobium halophilum]
MSERKNDWVEAMEHYMVDIRRRLHRVPEEGWTEYVATATIFEELQPLAFHLYMGVEAIESHSRYGVPGEEELEKAKTRARSKGVAEGFIHQMEGGHTGVAAVMDTEQPGPHLAFRFDIDALSVKESGDDCHFPAAHSFQSEEPGHMHACAHDGHTAIGLAFAHYLSEHKEQLSGKFTLLFQPAEEGGRGAKSMVDKGWLDDVDYFASSHIGIHNLSVGEISAMTSSFLASKKFDVSFQGEASHAGAKPELGRNALVAAASFVQGSYGISRHSEGQTRINLGTLHAGTGRNVVADTAMIQGEVRGETTALNDYMFTEVERIAEGAARMANVEAEVSVVGEGITGECDPEWRSILDQAAKNTVYINKIHDELPLGASEDVTYMMKRVQDRGGKATFMLLGTALPYGHHHPAFDFEEGVLNVGLSAYIAITTELMQRESFM